MSALPMPGGFFGLPPQLFGNWGGMLQGAQGAQGGGNFWENPQIMSYLGNLGAGILANNKPGSTFGQALGGGLQQASRAQMQQQQMAMQQALFQMKLKEYEDEQKRREELRGVAGKLFERKPTENDTVGQATSRLFGGPGGGETPSAADEMGLPSWMQGLATSNPEMFTGALTQGAIGQMFQKPEGPKLVKFRRGNQEISAWQYPDGRVEEFSQGDAFRQPDTTSVKVDASQKGFDIGTIPQGYEAIQDKETGAWSMRPVKGGPAALEIEAEQKKAEAATAQKKTYADIVVQDVDRVLEAVNKEGFPTTGFFGSMASNVPGTPAYDVKSLLDTIKANVGFNKLQEMRAASPTGGALGQVSEMENRLLQAAIGNVEQSQSKEQLEYNLKRVKEIYLDIIHGPGNRPNESDVVQSGVPAESDYDLEAMKRKYGLK